MSFNTVSQSKGSTVFFSSCMSSDKKTLLKIWLNLGLKLTITRGTRPRRNKKERLCNIGGKGGTKKGVLQKMYQWQIHTFLKELLDQISKNFFLILPSWSQWWFCIDVQWFLLQIVVVSPGTHLVKNHESLSITNESQFTNEVLNWKCLGLYVTSNS